MPGFRRGSRRISTLGAEGVFVLHELPDDATLTFSGDLDRLNNRRRDPPPASP